MSTVTPLSRIPQPMKGMNWEPSPSDYTSLPAPNKYGDTDFANDDFAALWNVDGNNVGRKDLATIQGLGCNTIKMYNWSVPQPNGYWMRNHQNFLAMAQQLGLSVIVPISNFFTGTAYNNRTSNGNPGGPSSDSSLQTWIQDIVAEVYTGGNPGPAIIWAIGNEFDNSNNGAYGYCEAQDIATIASYIIDAETNLGISASDVLAFTSPVTTALTPINSSISCTAPYNTLMGGCAINALIEAFTKAIGASATTERFIASVNSYQIGQQLVDYFNQFPTILPNVPMFYGELGFSEATAGAATQAQNIYSQFSTTIPQATAGSFFYGACCFEFSDELWKGAAGSTETTFGIYTFDGSTQPKSSNEGNHSPVWGAQYPVDSFTARQAVQCFQAALNGQAPPSACNG